MHKDALLTTPKPLTVRSVQVLSQVWLFEMPWTAAPHASLSIANSQSLHKLMSIESVMPSHHLILCRPLFLPPLIFPSIRVFSNESALHLIGAYIGGLQSLMTVISLFTDMAGNTAFLSTLL